MQLLSFHFCTEQRSSRQKSQVKGQLADVFITGSYVAYYDKRCDDMKEAFRSLLFFS